MGKIEVIKTLLLPISNHLFVSIPNPNDIIYDFSWEGPAKIKQTVLVKQYFEGGLRMVNLKAFINSMKVTWLRRLVLGSQ